MQGDLRQVYMHIARYYIAHYHRNTSTDAEDYPERINLPRVSNAGAVGQSGVLRLCCGESSSVGLQQQQGAERDCLSFNETPKTIRNALHSP